MSVIRSEMRHTGRLYRAWQTLAPSAAARAVRGFDRQKEQRIVEHEVRKAVIAYTRWSAWQGQSREASAARVGLTYTTLGHWRRQWSEGRLKPNGRGRPSRLSTLQQQNAVLETLRDCGPSTGLPALTALYPDIARRELAALISAYRGAYWQKYNLIYCLDWLVPGTVWAIDYTDTDPSGPIDGIYPHILVVRDLGSGRTLVSLPVTAATAEAACQALISLFKVFGPPVLLKSDHGSPFMSRIVQDLLDQNNVTFLLNPPYYPQYNGACEAGIGSLKVRAHHIAARNNRPGEWTCDDVEQARIQANQTARPKGIKGLTPDAVWAGRRIVTVAMRMEFDQSVRTRMLEVMKEEGVLVLGKADDRTQERIVRKGIERALVAHAFLLVRRRRIPSPFSSLFGSKIT
jgi:transposase InsO family protein